MRSHHVHPNEKAELREEPARFLQFRALGASPKILTEVGGRQTPSQSVAMSLAGTLLTPRLWTSIGCEEPLVEPVSAALSSSQRF